MAASRYRFRRIQRLSGPQVFRGIFARGVRDAAGHLQALAVRRSPPADPAEPMRLGISVSRKVGHAVYRNRIKRHLREAFRTNPALHLPGVDLVILVRPHRPVSAARTAELLVLLLERLPARLPAVGPAA